MTLDRALIIHGDSRYSLPPYETDLVFTSPPYNVGIDYRSHNDLMSPDDWKYLIRTSFRSAWATLRNGGRMVVNTIPLAGRSNIYLTGFEITKILDDLPGSVWMGQVIWDKGASTGSSTAWGSWRSARAPRFRGEYEVLYVVAKNLTIREDLGTENFMKDPISAEEFNLATREVWRDIPSATLWDRDYPHPVPFPPALAKRVIGLLTDAGDTVLDPFLGRGTTVMVAESMGRRGIGVEIDVDYVKTAQRLVEDNLIDVDVSHDPDCSCEEVDDGWDG